MQAQLVTATLVAEACAKVAGGLLIVPASRFQTAARTPHLIRPRLVQNPDSMRWNTMLVKVEIWAPTKGAEIATVTRMATILGTKVSVIS